MTPSPAHVARRYLRARLALFVLRPEGWNALGEEAYAEMSRWKRPGYVYRGMNSTEYQATVGAGKPVHSTGSHSFSVEGTNFSDDPLDAESYVDFGRDDPRKTGKSNYLVEVKMTDTMKRERDGYIKDPVPVPYSNVSRVWEMYPEDGSLWIQKVK